MTVTVNTPKLSYPGQLFCTRPGRNRQSCCLISSRDEGQVDRSTPHVSQGPQALGSLPCAEQNTNRFPKPPAHCAQLPEQIGSLILETTLHLALKNRSQVHLYFLFITPNSPRPVTIPHIRCFPDGCRCLPPSCRKNTNAHNRTQIQVPDTVLWVCLHQFL